MRYTILDFIYKIRFYLVYLFHLEKDTYEYIESDIKGYTCIVNHDGKDIYDNLGGDSNSHYLWGYPWGKDPIYPSDKNNISYRGAPNYDILLKTNNIMNTSAVIYSNRTYTYPIFRTIAALTQTNAVNSAVWTISELNNGLPEYDFEHCGQWGNKITATHHWGDSYEGNHYSSIMNGVKAPGFYPMDINCYEFVITPKIIKWKINGLTVKSRRRGIATDEVHQVFSISPGTYCKGTPSQDAEMTIHHNQVWLKTN